MSNQTIHEGLTIPIIKDAIHDRSAKDYEKLEAHSNPLLLTVLEDPEIRRLKRRWPTLEEISSYQSTDVLMVAMAVEKKMQKTTELVPPDGGYGWVIVLVSGLFYFITVPLGQMFGMIFQDRFKELGLSATQESFIIDLNSALGMMTGLMNGPLLNNFGYRKISYIGACLLFIGVFLLQFVENLAGYLFVYGFLTSLGTGISMSSYSLAVNTYFKEKRNKAVSLTLTIAGLGPIIMPQLMNFLMIRYRNHDVTLILSGICAHSFIFASLLQPIKNHMKKRKIENIEEDRLSKIDEGEEDKPSEDEFQVDEEYFSVMPRSPLRLPFPFVKSFSLIEHRKDSPLFYYDQDAAGMYGLDSTLIGTSMVHLPAAAVKNAVVFPPLPQKTTKTKYQWWRSASTVNLESCVNLFDESPTAVEEPNKVYNELSVTIPEPSRWKRFVHTVVNLFDLTLLKDPVYCNIMMGLSFAVFAEVDFSVSTAFILSEDFGMHTADVAEFLSILGTADIVFRFLAPYVGDFLKQPPRIMYMLALLSIISSRFLLLFVTDIRYIFLVAVALGCSKGLRTVYMYLVIPSYVPLERFPTASGIQMIVNGVFMLVGGPLIGIVRDATGSYKACIIIFNCLTLITVISWTAEFLLLKFSKKVEEIEEIPVVEVPEQTDVILNNNL